MVQDVAYVDAIRTIQLEQKLSSPTDCSPR